MDLLHYFGQIYEESQIAIFESVNFLFNNLNFG